MRKTFADVFDGCMRGRTMYVVPFCMGPLGSNISQLGVEITDSPYVAVSMRIMTRMGTPALRAIEETRVVRPRRALGRCPAGAGPGGRAVAVQQGQVHLALPGDAGDLVLRLRVRRERAARQEVLRPADRLGDGAGRGLAGRAHAHPQAHPARTATAKYIAAAFPSACGKTNLAMLQPTIPGWKVETVGDDIAWMRFGDDGRLYAINPEAGFFGVAPGTSDVTNANAIATLWGNSIFTNVALTDDGDVWWEGLTDEPPAHLTDWKGRDWTPGLARARGAPQLPVHHPGQSVPDHRAGMGRSRGRADLGDPVRRPARHAPCRWSPSPSTGRTACSSAPTSPRRRTAAAEGKVGELRRDPFAMLPFCGYNMGDYFAHWLDIGRSADAAKLPRIYFVNWFRKDAAGKFVWPGFGENSRVLKWIIERLSGDAQAAVSPIGRIPTPDALDTDGLDIGEDDLNLLLSVDTETWKAEAALIFEHLRTFGDHLPSPLWDQYTDLLDRLG